MKRILPRLRTLGYLAAFLLWLFVMLIPCFAFTLAIRGELEWRRGDYDWDRLWLIQERRQRGIGYQAERTLGDERANGGSLCVRNSVRYFFWEGGEEGADNDYCECYAADGTTSTVCGK